MNYSDLICILFKYLFDKSMCVPYRYVFTACTAINMFTCVSACADVNVEKCLDMLRVPRCEMLLTSRFAFRFSNVLMIVNASNHETAHEILALPGACQPCVSV